MERQWSGSGKRPRRAWARLFRWHPCLTSPQGVRALPAPGEIADPGDPPSRRGTTRGFAGGIRRAAGPGLFRFKEELFPYWPRREFRGSGAAADPRIARAPTYLPATSTSGFAARADILPAKARRATSTAGARRRHYRLHATPGSVARVSPLMLKLLKIKGPVRARAEIVDRRRGWRLRPGLCGFAGASV